jgi:hypothetical protein
MRVSVPRLGALVLVLAVGAVVPSAQAVTRSASFTVSAFVPATCVIAPTAPARPSAASAVCLAAARTFAPTLAPTISFQRDPATGVMTETVAF